MSEGNSQIEKFRNLLSKEQSRVQPLKCTSDNITEFCEDFRIILHKYQHRLPRSLDNRRQLYKPFLQILKNSQEEFTDDDYNIRAVIKFCDIHSDNKKKLSDTIIEMKNVAKTAIEIYHRTNVKTTIATNINGESGRKLTIVDVPDSAFYYDRKKRKKDFWIVHMQPIRATCNRCPFHLSTGTSNEVNFPNVWFPILRVKESEKRSTTDYDKGYLYKAQELYRNRFFRQSFFKLFKDTFEEDIEQKYINTYNSFFVKFSHWWQISISAAIDSPVDSGWHTDPFLIKVKVLALKYNFEPNPESGKENFTEKPQYEKITRYIVKEAETRHSTPKSINDWLSKNDALPVSQDI